MFSYLLDPLGIATTVFIYGCSYLAPCPDIKCVQWLNMYECHQRNFGDIHTPQYMAALKAGHNIKPRMEKPYWIKIGK